MATNNMASTQRGIQYPTSPTNFASADWWKAMAESTDNAIGQVSKDTSWSKSPLTQSTNLDTLAAGAHMRVGAFSTAQNYPISGSGTVSIEDMINENTNGMQVATISQTSGQSGVWFRRKSAGAWQPWEPAGGDAVRWNRSPLGASDDLDTLSAGVHMRVGAFSTAQNYPLSGSGTVSVENMSNENTNGVQVATILQSSGPVGVWMRRKIGSVWGKNWTPVGGAGNATGLQARTSVEIDGSWTTVAQMWNYLQELDKHPDAELVTIGQAYRGQDIPGIIIGDKTKPAFLAIGGQHGNEPSNTHGLMQWARDLLFASDQILLDMCVLIVPMVNLGNWLTWRNNPEMDLNRDWLGFTQPETRAVRDWIKNFNVIGAVDGHSFGYNREVSARIPTVGTSAIHQKAQKLYDAVGTAVRADGQFFRQYEWENKEGMFHEGMAALGIPAIFIEIPSGFGYENEPNMIRPAWQQQMSALAMNAAAHEVWKWTPTYPTELVTKNSAPAAGS